MKIKELIIPITKEIFVSSLLIIELSNMAFPDILEFIDVVDKLAEEAIYETSNSKLPFEINNKITKILFYQKLWNKIIKKGRG